MHDELRELRRVRFLIILLIWAIFCTAATATAQPSGTFNRTGSLITSRNQHTATLLPNGKVLIAGGIQTTSPTPARLLAGTELYDPSTGTFSSTGDMKTTRRMHTATLLADGRVLIAGGYGGEGGTGWGTALARAELYDPSTGTFRATGNMMTPRGGHSAILLPNGKVLLAGGSGISPYQYPDTPPAELYDPVTSAFTPAGPYVGHGACDFCAPATLLADGTVLFPGQYPAQNYDPVTNAFKVAGMMISDHSTAALLTNGKVLFAGGVDIGRSSSAELYEPATGTFASTGNMAWWRVWHSLTLLPNGTVLSAGGERDGGSWASAEIYDPSTGTFAATDTMAEAREGHTATLLQDGRVLLAGGATWGPTVPCCSSLESAELYTPAVLVPAPVLQSIFHSRTLHMAGREDPAAPGEALDIECTGLADDGVIPPQVAIGGRMAQVLEFGKWPGSSAMHRVTVIVPNGVAGPAVPVRLTYIGRPSNEVTIAVQP